MASYALPLPLSRPSQQSPRKRKRKPAIEASKPDALHDELMLDVPAQNAAYSAVVTPEERAQRRLAGLPLNEPLPPIPFPHAPAPLPHTEPAPSTHAAQSKPSSQTTSLRSQHLSAMMTLLHKALQARDYKRASRALGLILRTEIHGKFVDLRHAGLWRIGAEILLRTPSMSTIGRTAAPSREGLGRAKLFYDRMALQHPWHRSWPNATNAQDFKLAMFGLWIYVTCLESKRLQHAGDEMNLESSRDASDREMEAKRYELAEAESIAQSMDTLMSTIPFIDHLELIRLRAHVALWTADLHQRLDGLEFELEHNHNIHDQQMEQAWLGNMENEEPAPPKMPNRKAANARQLANTMLAKLGGRNVDGDSQSDEDVASSNNDFQS